MRFLLIIFCFGLTFTSHAFNWADLWATKDQQAMRMMKQGNYKAAEDTFEDSDWRAASAYRAQDYQAAAKLYQSFNNAEAFYNEGNALAHLGRYKEAIKAYDQTLKTNPTHQDALHNRKIIEELLKQQQNQDKQNQEQQNQDKQNQEQQNQDKQNQEQQNQDKQNQEQQNQDKQNQEQQNQDKQNQEQQNQDKQNQEQQNQDKQNQEQQNQDKQNQEQQNQDKQDQNQQTQNEREKQQAREQWLQLIPDDPGGLLREKFLRDHLRRQSGV